MEILKVENLSFKYPLCTEKSLDGISFGLERGDFLCVCGSTGSGKSTLLRMLKRELIPNGEKSGAVFVGGKCAEELTEREAAEKIGFVMQRPEQQIVTDRVWHELAFGLENLGIEKNEIRRRVSEMACYFDIEDWFERSTAELSGGQKQLLNLASVMVMRPDILILDEPTAQLDPIAASAFISTLTKLNRELSLTVIIAEHRLEEIIPASNRLLVLENGKTLAYGETQKTVEVLRLNKRACESMPMPVRLYCELGAEGECPLDVRAGRTFLEKNYYNNERKTEVPEYVFPGNKALEFSEVYFRYERPLPDVLRGLSFSVYEGEIFCILGGNGSGKSTALSCAAGLLKPYSGKIRVFGRGIKEYKNQSLYRNCLTMLPQDVQTVFLKNTVREELAELGEAVESLPFNLSPLYDKHPYDLSGGEAQLVGLGKVLASKPRLLLLDEPTKGLDAHMKRITGEILHKLKAGGMTLVIVTHDIEFAAEYADRCAMFFRGEITSLDIPHLFFPQNSFYTTAVSRMTRGFYDGAVTINDVLELCRANGRRESAGN